MVNKIRSMAIHDDVPLVLVAADAKEINGVAWQAVTETYLTAIVHGAGAVPVILPSLGPAIDIDAILARVDGVLLPGSVSNVHPARYGVAPSDKAQPHDEKRDSVTLPLVEGAVRHGLPLFAICRGMQEMNVALGGTLIAEVHETPGRHDHRAPDVAERDGRYAIRQDVIVTPGGKLAAILGAGPIRVNSLHRQAVERLAPPLAVEATAPDGTVEAVSVRDSVAFAIGVQWHPEYWVRTDLPSQRLFSAFGNAVRARLAARTGMAAAAAE
jgi:putative glutamine amidotransferase